MPIVATGCGTYGKPNRILLGRAISFGEALSLPCAFVVQGGAYAITRAPALLSHQKLTRVFPNVMHTRMAPAAILWALCGQILLQLKTYIDASSSDIISLSEQ